MVEHQSSYKINMDLKDDIRKYNSLNGWMDKTRPDIQPTMHNALCETWNIGVEKRIETAQM